MSEIATLKMDTIVLENSKCLAHKAEKDQKKKKNLNDTGQSIK